MIQLDISLIIQLVNFLILLAILNLIFYRPIRSIVKKRAERLTSDMSEMEQFNEKAENKLQEYERTLSEARREGVEIRNSYKEEGKKEEKTKLADANQEVSQYLDSARQDIREQEKTARESLDQQVDQFAQLVTDRILV